MLLELHITINSLVKMLLDILVDKLEIYNLRICILEICIICWLIKITR